MGKNIIFGVKNKIRLILLITWRDVMEIVKSKDLPHTYNVLENGKIIASFMRLTDKAAKAAARRFKDVRDKT